MAPRRIVPALLLLAAIVAAPGLSAAQVPPIVDTSLSLDAPQHATAAMPDEEATGAELTLRYQWGAGSTALASTKVEVHWEVDHTALQAVVSPQTVFFPVAESHLGGSATQTLFLLLQWNDTEAALPDLPVDVVLHASAGANGNLRPSEASATVSVPPVPEPESLPGDRPGAPFEAAAEGDGPLAFLAEVSALVDEMPVVAAGILVIVALVVTAVRKPWRW